MLSSETIEHILARIPQKAVLLIGDLFLDRYLDIDAARNEPSIETGLTAYQVVGIRNYPGALGTVMNNLATLGVGTLFPVTFLGHDGQGTDLLRELGKLRSVDTSGIVFTEERHTPTYCKPMLNEGGTIRELNRLDTKNRTPTSLALEDELIERINHLWNRADAVIVLDQVSEANCGVITERVREHILELAANTPEKFVLADSREHIGECRNVCIKPNTAELAKAGTVEALFAKGVRSIFLTQGELGISLFQPGEPRRDVPAFPVAGPIDICGAGDSCSAGIVCARLSGCSLLEAAEFGNLVASITIQQIGVTGTASPDQVRERWRLTGRL